MRSRTLVLAACVLVLPPTAWAQKDGKGGKGGPIALTAEELAKECAADRDKAEARYKGKALRVTGTVGDIYDDLLYLPVKVGAEEVLVGVRFGAGNRPAVKKGDVATFEGRFDRVAVLGPALVEGKLVRYCSRSGMRCRSYPWWSNAAEPVVAPDPRRR